MLGLTCGELDFGSEPANTCAAGTCCTGIDACFADPICAGLEYCINGVCQGAQNLDDCITQNCPDCQGGGTLHNAWVECMNGCVG